MLHLFYGNDTITVRQKAHDFTMEEEKKGMKVARIEIDTYAAGIFADIVGAVSLFGEKTLYVIDTPSGKTEIYDDVIAHLEALATSDNTFVVIEEALLAPQKKKFEKYAAKVEEYKKAAAERFNAFGMADSLSRKDKKTLWLQLQDARQANLSSEEIIGTLWWQLKSMRLAKKTNSANEAGMKDFTYNKAKRALGVFKEGELETISRNLLTVYHDGHLGKVDIDIALERWMLTL
ncbi:MAG: DNA polymerase III delta subunit [Acidimicrobiales bacterium]|jgi:DNA polymerase III delta subunit